MKSVRIRSISDSYFPIFGLNTDRYSLSLLIQSKCGKIRTRKTSNTDTFYVVYFCSFLIVLRQSVVMNVVMSNRNEISMPRK